MTHRLSHVIGFDDGPFDRNHRGDVLVVDAVFAGLRLEGVLSGKVRRDGINSTRVLADLIANSRYAPQIQVVLLQGIALVGFNVIDLPELHRRLQIPVVAIAWRAPNFTTIRRALLNQVKGGNRKWRLIEKLGPMEPIAGVFVQRTGLSLQETQTLIEQLAVHSALPEPPRTAHLISGGIVLGESHHRA